MSEDMDDIVDNLREPSTWIRILFMIGFAVVLYMIIAPIVVVMMVVQALFVMFTGSSNANLRRFGRAIGQYVAQILQFLTYNSHAKPFPFADFPSLDDEDDNEPAANPGNGNNKSGDSDSSSTESASSKKTSSAKSAGGAAKNPGRSRLARKKHHASQRPKRKPPAASRILSLAQQQQPGSHLPRKRKKLRKLLRLPVQQHRHPPLAATQIPTLTSLSPAAPTRQRAAPARMIPRRTRTSLSGDLRHFAAALAQTDALLFTASR